jgi:hypothetical protein
MTTKGSFKVPIYDCTVHLIVSDRVLRCINNQLQKDGEELLEICPGGWFYRPAECYCNYYIFFHLGNLSHNYINHEKSHLVEEILTDRGISPKGESRAFLDGFISHKIELFFRRHKKILKIS